MLVRLCSFFPSQQSGVVPLWTSRIIQGRLPHLLDSRWVDLRRHGTAQESCGAWNPNVSETAPGETLHVLCCLYHVTSPLTLFSGIKLDPLSVRTTSLPRTSTMSRRSFSRPSPPTSRTSSSLTRATRPGGAPCCPTRRRCSPCATSSTKAPTSTKSSCSIDDTLASVSSRWVPRKDFF